MPATKNPHDRLVQIVAMLRLNKYPNYQRFLREIQKQDPAGAPPTISRKTFQRDLDCLSQTYHAPIRYDPAQRGFYLVDMAWNNDDFLVEPAHMRSALISQQFVLELMPEPLRQESIQALNALLAHNESGMNAEAVLSSLQVFYKSATPVNPAHFYTVIKAWEKRKVLEIDYCDAQGKTSHKIFEPHIVAWANGVWYLKGLAMDLTNDPVKDQPRRRASAAKVRVLAIQRICAIKETPQYFDDHTPAARALKKGPLFTFQTIPEVRIRFAVAFARQVRERFAAMPQAIQTQPDGAVVLTLANIPHFEAVEHVLWAKGDATVLEPPDLITAITTIGQKILQNNPLPPEN